jgi:hypothetical protein
LKFLFSGYINVGGYLNLKRFEKFIKKLSRFDIEQFDEIYTDLNYLESKTGISMHKNEINNKPHQDEIAITNSLDNSVTPKVKYSIFFSKDFNIILLTLLILCSQMIPTTMMIMMTTQTNFLPCIRNLNYISAIII